MNQPQCTTVPAQLSAKTWGVTSPVKNSRDMEVHAIKVLGGGYCSRHRHSNKWNLFHVLDGHLYVEIFEHDGVALASQQSVNAGEELLVPPGVWHRFKSYTGAAALEVYWTSDESQVDPDDIERLDVGGRSY